MKLLFSIVLILNLFVLRAGHIVGGEIYYDYLGNNNYRFYISMYKDCDPAGQWANFDSPLYLAVYNASNNLIQNIPVPFTGSTNVPVVFNNPCVTPPTDLCILNAVYTTVINLPPTNGGYTISYQRCCRRPVIGNINFPGDTGFTLTCKVPGVANNHYINSSPRFTNYPPQLLCNNEDLIFDHSATDPDGDQLVYSLVTPYAGGSSPNNVMPNPAAPPPYYFVQWSNGYSAANPLGPGATISINPSTGLLQASPNLTGYFVVGIQVEEIRNGVVINKTVRDFLFRVFNCQLQLEAILPTQEQLPTFVSYCQGLTVDFVNNSYGGTNYSWDFGVPGITSDVSTAFAPTYTYPAPGIYEATMVVNPGWPCTDTAVMIVNVNNQLEVAWTAQDSLCIFDNNFDFVATTSGPPGTVFEWDFGPNASQANGNGQTVNNVQFSATGFIPVTVDASFGVCGDSYTDSIFIFPEPVAEMIIPADVECEGLTIQFQNNSQSSVLYQWDFGVPGTTSDVSTQQEPVYTYPGPGTYDVTLISGSTPMCSDTTVVSITLNEDLLLAFTSEDSLCITDNSFNFDGTVSGPPHTVYTWNFGPSASIQTSNDIDVNNVSFSTPGSIPITLTGTFDDCIESITQTIYLYREPTIDFTIANGLQCVPFAAQFIDLSFAETTIYYQWDFGYGTTSTQQNPSNLYTNTGNFPVTLTIYTDKGCVDTLTLTKYDLVNVRPNPEANFSIDPDYTDICHSTIQFTDESVGAVEFYYWFDDSTYFSNLQHPAYEYLTDGTHYPMQIVTNEWGCKDTAINDLYIEPFTVYAPNTFTPDGNEFNHSFLPIVYLDVESWKMQIFNRWGELVFESHDVNIPWDGTTPTGKIAPDGTYVWKITFVSCEPINPERTLTGHITLIR